MFISADMKKADLSKVDKGWENMTSCTLIEAAFYETTVDSQDRIFYFGGKNSSSDCLDYVQMFDPGLNQCESDYGTLPWLSMNVLM